ncbi:heparinase II/III family protein [Cerasicoccus frondis]|uniref:heparinase II/III family protein n=1 Tax=Cerasicoccus frondis TaxID=490090 RepID=UPI0028524ED2|nr:heparinase II/III family protein [Cerasicoccus frondis]
MKIYTLLLALLPHICLASEPWNNAAWKTSPPTQDDIPLLREEALSALSSSYELLYSQAANDTNYVSHARPLIEWNAWQLSHLYRLSGDLAAAEKAAVILAGLASRSTPEPPTGIHVEGKWIPYPAVISYGLIKNAPIWPINGNAGEVLAEKKDIESWLMKYSQSFQKLLDRPNQITNYTPFGLRHAASLALVTQDEALLQKCYETANHLAFGSDFWYADLIWQEGTVSYARQVTGNLKALLPLLEAGLNLDQVQYAQTDLKNLSERLNAIDEVQNDFRMPSGRPIPINDTHWAIPADSTPRAPRPIEFPDFGHFVLAGKDIESHLSLPALTGGGRYGGGHIHDSRLSLQLWGHGQELLPDAGYAFRPANNRYFHMSPLAHNMSLATDDDASYEDGPYGVWHGAWARSALLGYDNGQSSNGVVTYIAASSPGPENEGIKVSERALIQVATGDWSGYVVDCFWLQGGTVHRSVLRQTEDENVVQAIDAPLTDAGLSMAHVLHEDKVGDGAWTALLKSPMRVDTESSFKISWLGTESNVALNLFMAPQPGSTSWISRLPRLRPTNQDESQKDDFPGWHLLRQRQVQPEESTLWAGVYEPVADGEEPKILNVLWDFDESDSGVMITVVLKDRTDHWFLDRSSDVMNLGAYVFQGRAAGYSSRNDQILWAWAALGSTLKKNDNLIIDGGNDMPARVLSLQATPSGVELVVEGRMAIPSSHWAAIAFADGSGRGLYLNKSKETRAENTVFELETDPGFRVGESMMTRTAFPLHSINGDTYISPLGGKFNKNKALPTESDAQIN